MTQPAKAVPQAESVVREFAKSVHSLFAQLVVQVHALR